MGRLEADGLIDILFIENSPGLSGSTMSLCTLLNYLDPDRVGAHVVLSRPEQETYLVAHLRRPGDMAVIGPRRSLKRAVLMQRLVARGGSSRPWFGRLLLRIASLLDIFVVTVPYVWRLYQFAKDRRIKLVHQNNGFDLGSLILSRLLRVPLVAYQRGDEWNSPAVRWLAGGVQHYIANSATTQAWLTSLGIASRRISIVYPPLDLVVFDHRRTFSLGRSAFGVDETTACFGIVGNLVPWKGQGVFLRAARRVFDRIRNARAFVVGGPLPDGKKYETELKALARDLGIDDRVTFTGFCADVPEIMNLLDVVVHASISPEPFGRVIVEAMAMRRPVVASRAGGPLEIIEDGRTGFLVAPGDEGALASRVITLLEDRTLSARIAVAAYQDVERRFSPDIHAQEVQQVYETVLRSDPHQRPGTPG